MTGPEPNAAGEVAAPMRVLIVAGEASGDLHGASLARALRQLSPSIELVGVGGDRMQAAGVELVYHYRHLAVVGITEVIAHLGDVRRAMRVLEATAAGEVDAVVLIDYPDFNMTLARRLRRARPELPLIYYISPQVWAWRSGRVHAIARLVDLMLVILPFEEGLYRAAGAPVEFVGHPLLDVFPEPGDRTAFCSRHAIDPSHELVALAPGSRRNELTRLLEPMLEAARALARRPDRTFLIPVAASLDRVEYERTLAGFPDLRDRVRLVEDDYYEVLHHARGAVVCSGTATLEAALAATPEVVVYRTSWLTYNLGKLLVRIANIALVNVVAGRTGVPELIQHQVTPEAIVRELEPLLAEGATREVCLEFLRGVRERLGEPGASRRAARALLARVAEHPRSVRPAR
jgi:lipid-A-disaccharide synthase